MTSEDRALAATTLRAANWLTHGGHELVDLFLTHGRIVELASGQWAHGEGDEQTGVLMVLDGALQIFCKAPGDRELLINQMAVGDALGQTVRFGGGPRLITAIASEPSRILQVSDAALSRIAAEAPGVWEAVAALLYLQLRNLLEAVADLSALSPRERLARRLDAMTRGAPARTVRITQEALGEIVGLTRKTANLHLGAFEREGLICRAYGGIQVTDATGLRRVAGL